MRALSSRGPDKRIVFRGYVQSDQTSPLLLDCIVEQVRQCLDPLDTAAFVGHSGLISDDTTLLADIGSPTGLAPFAHLFTSAAFVSPRLVILQITPGKKSEWEIVLTSNLKNEPENSISRLRWRPSKHGVDHG